MLFLKFWYWGIPVYAIHIQYMIHWLLAEYTFFVALVTHVAVPARMYKSPFLQPLLQWVVWHSLNSSFRQPQTKLLEHQASSTLHLLTILIMRWFFFSFCWKKCDIFQHWLGRMGDTWYSRSVPTTFGLHHRPTGHSRNACSKDQRKKEKTILAVTYFEHIH